MPTYKLHFHEDINFWTTNKKVSHSRSNFEKITVSNKESWKQWTVNITNRVHISQPFMLHPLYVTPPRMTWISGIKSELLKRLFLAKKWWWFFLFWNPMGPFRDTYLLTRQANSGQIFLHWVAATLKGHEGFQNKKSWTTFHHHF